MSRGGALGKRYSTETRLEAWRLYKEENLGKKKISTLLDVPATTVGMWIARTREALEVKEAMKPPKNWESVKVGGEVLAPPRLQALWEVFGESLPKKMSEFSSIMPALCRHVRTRMAYDPEGYKPTREKFEEHLWVELEEFPKRYA